MSIEGGTISGVAGASINTGPAMSSSLAGGVSVGPNFNPAEFAPISSVCLPVNEGLVAPSFLENTAPLVENISKSPEISIPPVFLESFTELVNNPATPNSLRGYLEFNQDSEVVASFLPRMTSVVSGQTNITESAQLEAVRTKLREVSSRARPQAMVQIEVTTQTSEIEESKVGSVLEEERKHPGPNENTEIERLKAVIVEAEEVSKVRETEIGEAGQKAHDEVREEARELGVEPVGIDGKRMEKYLTEHEGNISPIRRGMKGDGSLEQTFKEMTSRVFKSVGDIKEAVRAIIPKNRPGKYAREGNMLEDKEVAKIERRNIMIQIAG